MNDLSKKPIVSLWNAIKGVSGLSLDENVFLRSHEENEEDQSNGFYVILRDEITNVGRVYSEGSSKIRECSCDILLVAYDDGSSQSGKFASMKESIESALKGSGMDYSGVNLGWDGERSQYSFEVTVYA